MRTFDITAFDSLKKLTVTFDGVQAQSEASAIDTIRRCIVLETGTPSKHIKITKIKEVADDVPQAAC